MAPKKRGRRGRKRASPKERQDVPAKERETPKGKRDIAGTSSSIANIFLWLVVVQWTNGPSWEGELSEGWFREKDLQGLNQSLVLQYWEDKGGRDACCDFDTRRTHFLAIHDERVDAKSHRKSYQMQLVGCRNDPNFWVEAGSVYPLYPELVKTWRARQRRDLEGNEAT
ncbi:uncharacterized protein NECHADRAFT_83017 [Fusarium vanettenii 77-13-4]|uniref:Chromo domain-containing protein n=1 Tax=Fusarium vanettenii (strain ATCC MYA-4622 / CBS 123669 / FGSC 9596 / NRRL 45880 / 77-13-4) TaxID=660122 RepID=C7ZB94_FUSV7|nr:uncharacterized protein NECHADRAFT_83017 [Fusarium vanettenii 77-13-4]EEU38656.1 predicted protein [Fusarium vanettenii 77-13-4]